MFFMHFYKLFFLILIVNMAGCASIVEKFNNGPIQLNKNTRTVGSWINDETLETISEVNIIKTIDQERKNSRIKVVSYNQNILILGSVPHENLKIASKEAVQKIKGVKKVYNELFVGKPISFIQQGKDTWITTQLKTRIIKNKQLRDNNDIIVNTENNIIYLMGTIDREYINYIINIAKKIHGVKKVVSAFEYLPTE